MITFRIFCLPTRPFEARTELRISIIYSQSEYLKPTIKVQVIGVTGLANPSHCNCTIIPIQSSAVNFGGCLTTLTRPVPFSQKGSQECRNPPLQRKSNRDVKMAHKAPRILKPTKMEVYLWVPILVRYILLIQTNIFKYCLTNLFLIGQVKPIVN